MRIVGLGSFAGFDLNVLRFLLETHEVPKEEWIFMLEKIEAISSVAMRHWTKKETDKK